MPERTSGVPYWVVFIAGLLSALILLLTGVMLGYVTVKPITLTTIFFDKTESTVSADLR